MFISMKMAPRTRDPGAKRAALHESAYKLLAEQRYEEVPVSHIAAQAGVAVGTFYRFYPTKMALLEAMSDALEEEFVLAMREAWQHGGDYRAKISDLSAVLFHTIATRRTEIGVMQMTAGHRSSDSKPMGDAIREEIGRLYVDGIKNGRFENHDPASFAAAAHGMVEGMMRYYLAQPTAANKAYSTEFLTKMLLKLVSVR